ncbi:hypothetical protein T4Y61_12955 [Pseudomonas aeruginosa]|uniref:hypothetical protein n=2 Tax=Pseudomonas aeruginosa TaxID=287 RepID=UPI0004F3573E|nr:hypothetical protein [Pseudomonas aeruginosa]EMB9880707.1 hypothetical protein [Pseudomonas aeruginosa]KHE35784.1 hypothetical protein LH31_07410 [Pseudomonas aeruginosa]MBH4087095.1 hypothetical protein [Pseudomonas aeruginosa]MED5069022.1 hypothetical protein [Pseudomonas aeruginosa]RUI14492.1 hypothetical protein IPC448_22460 [Pseudomonas aeruginosa]
MDRKIAVARCHEIQLAMKDREAARLERIPEIGMAVQLALHIRGLPILQYSLVKLVATTLIGIPRLAVDRITRLLAEIEFVRLIQEGKSIKSVLPTVPYFEDLYDGLGEYFETESGADEFETLTLEIVDRLAGAPHNADSLASALGADRKAFDDSIEIGTKSSFLIKQRHRTRDILMNPTYFTENADIFADHVAKVGAKTVQHTLDLLKRAQGWPLALIEKTQEIGGKKVSADEVALLKRLAQDGMVKPPSIITSHAGQSMFMFTPTPGQVNVSPLKREQYERALAIVSAVRQGELLPNRYSIRNPGALLYRLKTDLQLKPTSDYAEQYQNLVLLRIAKLEKQSNGWHQLKIIDTPENRESLNIAYNLVQGEKIADLDIDKDAIAAMTGSQEYVESLVSSKLLREREKITLSEETQNEVTQLLLEGI